MKPHEAVDSIPVWNHSMPTFHFSLLTEANGKGGLAMQKDNSLREETSPEGEQCDDGIDDGVVCEETLRSGKLGAPGHDDDASSGRSVGGEIAFFTLIAVLLGYCGYSVYGEFGGRDSSPYKGDHSHEPR